MNYGNVNTMIKMHGTYLSVTKNTIKEGQTMPRVASSSPTWTKDPKSDKLT